MAAPEPLGDEPPIIDLGREIASDAARLVRAEIALARAEMAETLTAVRKSVVRLAIAATFLLFLSTAAIGTLASGLGPRLLGAEWRGWGVLGILFLLGALILGVGGYRSIRRSIAVAKGAAGTLREDAQWLTRLAKRGERGS